MRKTQTTSARQLFLMLATLLMFLFTGALLAQNDSRDDKKDDPVPTLDPRVASDLLEAYELLEEDRNQEALEELNALMNRRGDSMKGFDKASVLQIRGTTYVNLDDLDSALIDFSA